MNKPRLIIRFPTPASSGSGSKGLLSDQPNVGQSPLANTGSVGAPPAACNPVSSPRLRAQSRFTPLPFPGRARCGWYGIRIAHERTDLFHERRTR
jgi:hypothetical protein